ncbi:hypothetical protein TOPH_07415 [Tolypocladium ophioglossoides CBS 100239]|uniref:RING-type domain-containing protein n=1 Tax=Tolypocladium ophioglossoides (strain CBS 100239) TaxID=1163406 RepID=A0A0L0N1M9_TOLOC|nr:hypothetical protein TOPH_07415 [Tolypocladium ophioglossoides CBS 100239]
MEEVREDAKLGPASRNTALAETTALPREHSYLGLKSARKKHGEDHGVAWEVSSMEAQPSATRPRLRSSRSADSMKDKATTAFEAIPADSTVNSQFSRAPTSLRKESSPLSSTGRQRDALAMFDLYGVSMPEGWLPPEKLRPESQTKTLQICHSCGENLVSQERCSNCGHDFCFKCATKVLDGKTYPSRVPRTESGMSLEGYAASCSTADDNIPGSDEASLGQEARRGSSHPGLPGSEDERLSDTPTPSVNRKKSIRERSGGLSEIDSKTPPELPAASVRSRSAVRDSPFFKADCNTKAAASTPQTTPTNARARKPRRVSDCMARRLIDRSSTQSESQEQSSDLSSEAGDHGHQGERHSICCTARRGLVRQSTNDEPGPSEEDDGPLGEILQRKIDQLYRHAEELHTSRHAMRHLASALEKLDCSSGPDQDLSSMTAGSLQSSNATPTRHPRIHSLEQDERTPVGSLSRTHDLREDLTLSALSPLRPRRPEADDVFGPHESLLSPGSALDHDGYETLSPQTPAIRNELVGSPVVQSPYWGLSSRREQSRVTRGENPQAKDDDGSLMARISHSKALSEGSAGKISKNMLEVPTLQGTKGNSRPGRSTAPALEYSSSNSTMQSPQIAYSAASAASQDFPSMTGYPRHRQGTILCPPPQGMDPWPRLRRVGRSEVERPAQTPGSVPWSRDLLRKVSRNVDGPRKTDEAPTPPAWRLGLGKTDERGQASPANSIAPSTPASQWRQILTKAPEAPWAQPERRANICSFCDPNPMSSPAGDGKGSGGCSHVNTPQADTQSDPLGLDDSATPSRLRVRQVEHSLARKRAEEELEEEARRAGVVACTPTRGSCPSDGTRRGPTGKDNLADGVLPDEHSCVWRDRYLDLSVEVEKWKSELNSCDRSDEALADELPTRRDKGVGVDLRQGGTADDVGIEGLTIVVHMRYKDDLVINTDLRGEGSTGTRG